MNRFFARSLRASLLLGLFAACGDPGGGDEPADPRDDPEVVIGSDTIGKRDGESLRAFEDSINRIECACVSGHSCGKDFTARSSNEALEACWAHSWEVDIATEPAETTECRIGTLEAHRACLLDRAKKCDQQLVDACDNAAGDAFEACGPRGEEAEEALIACEELR